MSNNFRSIENLTYWTTYLRTRDVLLTCHVLEIIFVLATIIIFTPNFFFCFFAIAGSPWEISVMTSGSIGPKVSVIGETVGLVPANHVATFQISAIGFKRNDIRVLVLSKY